MEKKLRPVLSVRIFAEEKCFGPGVAALLNRIHEHHSLRAAAMSMGMAYSKAWTIVKQAERELGWKAEKDVRQMCADSWNFMIKNR